MKFSILGFVGWENLASIFGGDLIYVGIFFAYSKLSDLILHNVNDETEDVLGCLESSKIRHGIFFSGGGGVGGGVLFWSRDFFGFVGNPRNFGWVLIFTAIRLSPSLEIRSTPCGYSIPNTFD